VGRQEEEVTTFKIELLLDDDVADTEKDEVQATVEDVLEGAGFDVEIVRCEVA
jgi:hypothetical protein